LEGARLRKASSYPKKSCLRLIEVLAMTGCGKRRTKLVPDF
jgi:hypothetical protein